MCYECNVFAYIRYVRVQLLVGYRPGCVVDSFAFANGVAMKCNDKLLPETPITTCASSKHSFGKNKATRWRFWSWDSVCVSFTVYAIHRSKSLHEAD